MNDSMTSSRPYLLRALNTWIQDNDMTPHIVVDASQNDVVVPNEFISSGKIVLNISASAVHALSLENDYMCFSARFSGRAMDVIVPISAIMAIYAKENGQGMVFSADGSNSGIGEGSLPASEPVKKQPSPPPLRLVQ